MKLAVSALVVLLGGACSGPTTNPQNSPQPPTATSAVSMPLVPLGFSCRLPIFRPFSGSANPPPVVGSWSLPDGRLSFGAAPRFPQQGSGDQSQPAGFSYDRVFSLWLPVPRNAVSPDGKHYAYHMAGKDVFDPKEDVLHIVDVATGHDQVYPAIPPNAGLSPERFVVLDYAREGIYLALAYEGPLRGLWLMDVSTGGIRHLVDFSYLQVVGGGAAWLGSVNPADPSHPPAGLVTDPDTIDRFDLATGVRTTWLYMAGMAVYVIGLDLAGHPIVEASSGSPAGDIQLLLLTGPGTSQAIFTGTWTELNGNSGEVGTPIADSHGVWFGSSAGIFLYSAAGGFRKVSDLAFFPGNGCA
jgi:hypothetical protein